MPFTLAIAGQKVGKTHTTRLACVIEAVERGLVYKYRDTMWLDHRAEIVLENGAYADINGLDLDHLPEPPEGFITIPIELYAELKFAHEGNSLRGGDK